MILIFPLIAYKIDGSTIESDDSINVILEISNKGS